LKAIKSRLLGQTLINQVLLPSHWGQKGAPKKTSKDCKRLSALIRKKREFWLMISEPCSSNSKGMWGVNLMLFTGQVQTQVNAIW
jgi:hypothetical protein